MNKKELSNAAAERAAAKKALIEGSLKEYDTYSAKQVATRCGTDAKTMRKFFRSNYSTIEPVGQGSRYEFDARDLPQIRREFDAWQNRSAVRKRAAQTPQKPKDDIPLSRVADAIERAQAEDPEPTDAEIFELEDLDLEDLED